MNNIDMNKLMEMLSKMDKKDIEKGMEQASKMLGVKDREELLKKNAGEIEYLSFRLPFGVIFIILSFLTGFATRLRSFLLGSLDFAELLKLEILLQNGSISKTNNY